MQIRTKQAVGAACKFVRYACMHAYVLLNLSLPMQFDYQNHLTATCACLPSRVSVIVMSNAVHHIFCMPFSQYDTNLTSD